MGAYRCADCEERFSTLEGVTVHEIRKHDLHPLAAVDVNGFSVIGVGDALARLKQRLSGWANSGLPDNAMAGIHVGDVRRLWETAGLEDLPIARSTGLTPRNLSEKACEIKSVKAS